MTSWFVVLLVAALYSTVSGQLSQRSAASIEIKANPTSITDGSTPYLKVNCTVSHLMGSQFSALAYLVLYKTKTVDDTSYSEVASVSSSGYRVETKDTLGATSVTGLLDAFRVSYIAYEWSPPHDEVRGRYMCEAKGMDSMGRPINIMAFTRVGAAVADFNYLQTKIDQLNATLQKQTGGGSVQVDALQSQVTNLTSLLHDQKLLLDSQSGQLVSLGQQLARKDVLIQTQTSRLDDLETKLKQLDNFFSNQTSQTDLQTIQQQLTDMKSRLDVQVSSQLDLLNSSISQTIDQVSQCLASQTTDHGLIITQTSRLDQVEASLQNQTLLKSDLVDRLDKVKAAVMVTSREFHGKRYFLSEPMWRNIVEYEGFCQLIGGSLVELGDQAEYDFLKQLITDQNVTEQVFVSGTDQVKEGRWIFQASGQAMTYFQWASGFPSTSVRENCVMLEPRVGWQMEDTYCVDKQWGRFVCQVTN